MTPITRRVLLGTALVAGGGAGPETTAWGFKFPSLDGGTLDFAAFRGHVLLVANTASFCGFTYQYEGLEKLQRELAPRGLVVIGIPSQDFGQESAENGKVKEFCELTYGVEFPMTEISHVRGADAMPFYAWVQQERNWQPDWNFNKVLIGRDGRIKATYRSKVEPASPELMQAIEAELAQQA